MHGTTINQAGKKLGLFIFLPYRTSQTVDRYLVFNTVENYVGFGIQFGIYHVTKRKKTKT